MELLADYKHMHGDVDVPLKYESNPSLGTFVNRQRTEYRKMQNGKPTSMTPARVEDLNRLCQVLHSLKVALQKKEGNQ